MKFTTLISILSLIGVLTVFGVSYAAYEMDDYYEDEAYYQEFSEAEFATMAGVEDQPYAQNTGGYQSQQAYATKVSYNFTSNGPVPLRPLVDPKTGKASAYAPIPKSWKLGNKWESPNGATVEMRQGGTMTAQQRPLRSVDQVIQQFMPEIRKAGIQVDNIIDLPGIASNNEKNQSLYWEVAPSRKTFQTKGIEITDPKTGNRGLMIINLMIMHSQFGDINNYYAYVMSDAKFDSYQKDKQALIHALEGMELDRQTVAMHNQREQQKSQASWSAHNQRMAQNQANFNSWQQTQQTLSDVNDIYYQGYKNRTQMQDAGHQNFVNGVILEQNSGVNPYNGQQMNTSIHNKYNYVNQYGQVFGTNNPNYNPALDPNMNHMEWKKVQGNGGNY